MKTVIEMAREAGFETLIQKGRIFGNDRDGDCTEELEAFAALVRADEKAQRTWIGLRDDERQACINYRAVEAKLKEKNI